jgi:phage anti-repressor protein
MTTVTSIAVTEEWKDDKLFMWVNARVLWEALGVSTRFNDWFRERCVTYGFEEGKDFYLISSKSTGGRPTKDYKLTLDMAKELAMVEKTNKGREARQYFLKMERRALGLDLIGDTAKDTLANIDRMLRVALVHNQQTMEHERRLDQHDQEIAELKDRPVIQPKTKVQDLSILRIKFDRALKRKMSKSFIGLSKSQIGKVIMNMNRQLIQQTGRKRDTWKVEHYIIAVEWLAEAQDINIADILKDRKLEEELPLS